MPRSIKIPPPPDPLGLLKIFTGGKELELPVPDLPFPLPFPGEGVEEAEEKRELGWKERSEEGKVLDLLEAANRELKRGNIEGVYTHLDYAERLSQCDRCIRGMKSIEQKIKSGDLPEARRRLKTLITLIPAYYEVIEKEGDTLSTELNGTKKIEKECSSCNAAEIVEICGWDVNCIDHVISYIDEKKQRGERIFADELVRKAKEYRKI